MSPLQGACVRVRTLTHTHSLLVTLYFLILQVMQF